MKHTIQLLLAAALLAGCSPAQARPSTARTAAVSTSSFKMRSVPPPAHPTSVAPAVISLALACCDSLGNCIWVNSFGDCDFPDDVYYCDQGQTNPDGTVSCF